VKKYTDKSTKNHISIEHFDGSVEIMAMLLVTPLFRDVMFFSNEEDQQDLIDDETEKWTDDMMNRYTEEISNDNNTSSNSSNNIMMANMKVNKPEDMKYKIRFYPQKLFKDQFEREISNLKKERMVEIGFDRDDVEDYSISPFFKLTLDHEPDSMKVIMLYYMTYNEFRALAFFEKSIRTFVKMVFEEKFDKMYTKMISLPVNVINMYKKELEKNVIKDDGIKDNLEIWTDFMTSLDKMGDLNNNIMANFYESFKIRVRDFLMADKLATYMDMHKLDNREWFMCMHDRTSMFDNFEKIRMSHLKNHSNFEEYKEEYCNSSKEVLELETYDTTLTMSKMLSKERAKLMETDSLYYHIIDGTLYD